MTPVSSEDVTFFADKLLSSDEKLDQVIRKDFGERDSNGDGLLTLKELRQFYKNQGAKPERLKLLEVGFGKIDKDHTGEVNFQEYRSTVLHMLSESNALLSIMENMFHKTSPNITDLNP
ncbi:unnamed protein product [Caenorhabditis auriculariae]|uniref:EF-hand domain-containing protein n=1 Tax=Caenorhabditis auriculariae TaxID=2777116 RepID=A0A8S1HTV3_9PELO|nr:unnamed protein product [Caenorhabditis auriculariae]